jgi:hypothetical protein
VPPLVFVFGALGVVALGSFAYFGVRALNDASNLRETCAPVCEHSDVRNVKTENVISGVSLGVGLVSLGLAAWILVSHSSKRAPSAVSSRF